MQSGLIPDDAAATGEFHVTGTGGADEPTQQGATSGQRSHLDSFFEGSRWTREDVLVVVSVLHFTLLLTLTWSELRS